MKEQFAKTKGFKKGLKIIGYFFICLVVLIVVSALSFRIYFDRNKTEIIAKINTQINDNIKGKVSIGDIEYKFLRGLPDFTLALNQVEVKDSLWHLHQRSFLKAKEIDVRLNVFSLLKNEVNIHKIVINDATVDMFKDKNGNVNSDIFKPKKTKSKSSTTTSIDEIVLNNVTFISENQKGKKLFHFEIKTLKSKVNYDSGNWKTDVKLKVFAKKMSFNVERGSFIKDKLLEGHLEVKYSEKQDKISVATEDLKIGEDLFNITAHFNLGKNNSLFDIDIKTTILWQNASNLLADNISSKLNHFGLQIPLKATCAIKGDMNATGDPEIVVNAVIKDDVLKTSYGLVTSCSFKGKYTNNYKKGLAFTDANSAVIVTDFKGDFKEIPITISSGIINNFDKPVATGKFNSEFDVVQLKNLINENFIHFTEGNAKVNLDFNIDIVDLKLHKPKFTGNVDIKNASFIYKPKNANFQKTDIELNFTEQALLIKKIKYQNKKNMVFMEGKVDNFLNLYYDDPEKMNVNWKIYSPFLDLKQIISVLSYRDKTKPSKPVKANKNKNSSDELQVVFSKSRASIDLLVDKMTYNKMMANKVKVSIVLANSGLYITKGAILGRAGSSVTFDGQLVPKNNRMVFKSNINISKGEISRFLTSFNNFGIKSFSLDNIKGKLSTSASVGGILTSGGDLIANSIAGDVKFNVSEGALVNFEPIVKVGKFAFPFRDVRNITFSDLHGFLKINGEKIYVNELKVSSNVLNIDANGLYSLNKGTNLALSIPLRNPEDDYKVTDKIKRDKLRNRGIVLHLLVIDDKNGKTKIKWGKDHKEKNNEK